MEIFFPHDKSLHGKILPHSPVFPIRPHPNVKCPAENVCTLHNNHYYMQTMVKVYNLQPLPRGLRGIKSSPKIYLLGFRQSWNSVLIQQLMSELVWLHLT